MTMENHELNNKILRNVRNKIVVSNLEREENMKISKQKQAISVLMAMIVLFSGGFLTVNAATDGKLVEEIKQKYEEIIVVKLDEDNYKITTEKDNNGKEYISYRIQTDEIEEVECIFYENNMVKQNIQAVVEEGEEEAEIKFYDYEQN